MEEEFRGRGGGCRAAAARRSNNVGSRAATPTSLQLY